MAAEDADAAPRIKILLATRLDPPADVTARAAARLARDLRGALVVLYVTEELETVPRIATTTGTEEASVREQILREVHERVEEFVRACCPAEAAVRVAEGDAVREIVRIAREEGADYLVVGTQAHGVLRELVVGSTTHEILRHAPCPVVVVPLRSTRSAGIDAP
ncbi:MAG TPA: universal stress protein [Longimicrobiaceae bacterium]|nr:universal stress protein [Longimicrobiaceae bacterium]